MTDGELIAMGVQVDRDADGNAAALCEGCEEYVAVERMAPSPSFDFVDAEAICLSCCWNDEACS